MDYNNHRPHSSLSYMTPAAFAASCNPPDSAEPGGLQDKERGGLWHGLPARENTARMAVPPTRSS